VVSVTTEATLPFTNTPPPAGYQFVVYTIQAIRQAADPQSPILLNPRLLGSSKAERGAATAPTCIGGAPDNDQVNEGGTVNYSACIAMPTGDVRSDLLLGVGSVNTKWFVTVIS
jgi:hypothetical protein